MKAFKHVLTKIKRLIKKQNDAELSKPTFSLPNLIEDGPDSEEKRRASDSNKTSTTSHRSPAITREIRSSSLPQQNFKDETKLIREAAYDDSRAPQLPDKKHARSSAREKFQSESHLNHKKIARIGNDTRYITYNYISSISCLLQFVKLLFLS